MRKLIVTTFLTLDGVMQAPGGPEEDDSGGFAHGGWSMNYWDDLMGEAKSEELERAVRPPARTPDLRDLRRRTGRPPPRRPAASRSTTPRSTSRSRSRPSLDWGPAVLIEGDAAEGVAALKEEDDGPELQVHGSGNLAQTLIRHGLVDEYHLWVFPLVLGHGQAPVRRRHDPRRAAARRLEDLHHRGLHGHLRAGRRGRHGLVLAPARPRSEVGSPLRATEARRCGRASRGCGNDAARAAWPCG